jgi:uncharacterized protein (TIGR02271 family)
MYKFTGQIREGMVCRSADGDKLGKVIQLGEDTFMIEKGLLFPRDYLCRFADVIEVRDDEIFLARRKEELVEAGAWSDTNATDTSFKTDRNLTDTNITGRDYDKTLRTDEEVRVPLAEEELEVQRRSREAGEVRIRKEVKVEQKTITVPVTREEVHVERVPVTDKTATSRIEFQDQTISIPVHEEEVEIRKRPVVREEVRVSKTRHQEQRTASADVRREEVDIDDSTVRKSRTDIDVEKSDSLLDPDTKKKYDY